MISRARRKCDAPPSKLFDARRTTADFYRATVYRDGELVGEVEALTKSEIQRKADELMGEPVKIDWFGN